MRVDINLSAIRHNLGVIRQHAQNAKIMAVVKADAYGHGIEAILNASDNADALAVATIEEGVEVRERGYTKPVIVLSRLTSMGEIGAGHQYGLEFVLHTKEQLQWYLRYSDAGNKKLSNTVPNIADVWVKYDSGMHRLGFRRQVCQETISLLQDKYPTCTVGLISHFACADERSNSLTTSQIASFQRIGATHSGPKSIANSAGILGWPDSHFDWVRPGIALYGASPFQNQSAASLGLQPVMALSSRLIAIREHRAGESVGYGSTWTAKHDTSLGVVSIGYGDGYPRVVADGTPVFISGKRYPIVGRISMDSLSVDLGRDSGIDVGASVEMWGSNISVDEVAASANTIGYELLTRMSIRQTERNVHE